MNVGIWYLAYVQQRVFGPADVSVRHLPESNHDATAARLVDNAGNTTAGGKLARWGGPPDLDGCGGHANLHLSALDLAKFMAHLTHGTLLDAGQPGHQARRTPPCLGWNNVLEHDGDHRHLLARRRRILYEQRRHCARVHVCLMKFPGYIEATLVVNSNITSWAPASARSCSMPTTR